MSKMNSWMMGAILGGFLGSALVLLYTPAKGSELKGKLQETVQKIRDEVRQAVRRIIDHILDHKTPAFTDNPAKVWGSAPGIRAGWGSGRLK